MHLPLRTRLSIATYALAILLSPFVIFAHESSEANSTIIHVSDLGYEPNNITVEQGTVVIFENESEAEHWPASDEHPSHADYSGTTLEEHCSEQNENKSFDSCRGIRSGETWSFTFEKIGTHSYHDHLWPHLVGTITVTKKAVPDTSILSVLKNNFNKFTSFIVNLFRKDDAINLQPRKSIEDKILIEQYVTTALEQNPYEAIAQLETDAAVDANVSSLCHDILHNIGKSAYKKYGSFDGAVIYQTEFCNSGYIHGLFEAYFEHETVTPDLLTRQCASYSEGKSSFYTWQCYHGIGHGLMYHSGGDLDLSITLCQSYFDEMPETSCINGAYMEVFDQEILSKKQTLVDSNNPFAVCRSRNVAKNDCYFYLPTYLIQTLSLSYHDAIASCEDAGLPYRDNCIAGVGAEAMKRNVNDPHAILYFCELENKPACAYGAINMYIFQTGSYDAGSLLCQVATPTFQTQCSKALEEQRDLFGIKPTIGLD
jgi:plastocyanin